MQTFEWDGMPGYVSIDSVSFEDLGMESGMNETFDRLDELLAGQAD